MIPVQDPPFTTSRKTARVRKIFTRAVIFFTSDKMKSEGEQNSALFSIVFSGRMTKLLLASQLHFYAPKSPFNVRFIRQIAFAKKELVRA